MSAINNALSGFNAAAQRVNVSAQNIANADSTQTRRRDDGTVAKEPYTPQRVVQTSRPEGGVETRVEQVRRPEIPDEITVQDNLTEFVSVDRARELVEMKVASYDANANLKMMKADNQLFGKLLDVLS